MTTQTFLHRFGGVAAALVLGISMALSGPAAVAEDVIHLKDGRTLSGEILREVEGHVWFKLKVGGIEQTQVFAPAEITSIERDAESKPEADAKAAAPAKAAPKARAANTGAPRAAIITLGEGNKREMVGMYVTAKSLRDAIPLLEQENVDIVVFLINSGGGLTLEVPHLNEVIQNEYKPRFRTVAWIESAISAAAMTAHVIEEIYFMPRGNYGACTMFRGALDAAKGRELEEVLYDMERVSALGGYHPAIMRSMQIMEPLSADITPDGDVRWSQSADGQYLVNPPDRILTFNSETAAKFKFSRGTVSTLDELGRAMGLQEVEWVGTRERGYSWPISRAERMMMDFRLKVERDERQLNGYYTDYNRYLAIAQSTQDKRERGKWIGQARTALGKIESMVKTNPNFALLIWGLPSQYEEWLAIEKERLRELAR